MLDYDEIRAEIARLENGCTTWADCEKLAILYEIVKNADTPREMPMPAARTVTAPTPASEFEAAARACDYEHLLNVMNEHMKAIAVLYPVEYAKILRQMRET